MFHQQHNPRPHRNSRGGLSYACVTERHTDPPGSVLVQLEDHAPKHCEKPLTDDEY